ncbi:hypothetical protein [Methylobacterium sp. J-067]|uniref:hypothetical protein n=1 Tax=Methylobacterium sp. J-067 TaxID=2836648 RepID=UPI001FBAB3BF|nr:hypothetical protein [Methylobacterium sp. J-067]MCJ2023497.1 hypothetical protein [Methylobacterium sp. J-067]
MTGPSFTPAGLLRLETLLNEVETEDLGSLLASGSISAMYYSDATSFSVIPPQVWLGEHARIILTGGVISAEVAAQVLGIWTRGQDLPVFVREVELDRYLEPASNQDLHDGAATAELGKPLSEADTVKAIEMLRYESVTQRMTKPERREFLSQAFPGRHITEPVFRRIEREAPAKIGRPKKDDRKV